MKLTKNKLKEIIREEIQKLNESSKTLEISFNNRSDYNKGISAFNSKKWRNSTSGNPPTGKEPGSYNPNDHWLVINVYENHKQAIKLLKGKNVKFTTRLKKPMNYVVHNHGGYLD